MTNQEKWSQYLVFEEPGLACPLTRFAIWPFPTYMGIAP